MTTWIAVAWILGGLAFVGSCEPGTRARVSTLVIVSFIAVWPFMFLYAVAKAIVERSEK